MVFIFFLSKQKIPQDEGFCIPRKGGEWNVGSNNSGAVIQVLLFAGSVLDLPVFLLVFRAG